MFVMFIFVIGLSWFLIGYVYIVGIILDWMSWVFIKDVGYYVVFFLFCVLIV